jgi:hypothetical protein
MARPRNVRKFYGMQGFVPVAHIAAKGRNVQKAQENRAKTTNRPKRNVRPFILPS